MNENKPCPFGNERCLCADCTDNAAYDDCKRGYCLECLECIEAGKQVHDVYLCTGHTERGGGAREGTMPMS